MQRVFRGACAIAVVLSLALPAAADSRRDDCRHIAKVVRTWLVQIFGDGLVDPWP
jgi:hypothetical protein